MVERTKQKQGWFIDSFEGNIKDEYHFVEKLASGGFGIVYLAENRKTCKFPYPLTLFRAESCNKGHPKEEGEGLYDFQERN